MVTTVKETGIIMQGHNVLRCMDGTKTQTRRTGKMRGADKVYWHKGKTHAWKGKPEQEYEGWVAEVKGLGILLPLTCRYGKPGDRLVVREALRMGDRLIYAADGKPVENIPDDAKPIPIGYRSASYMPRYASRVTLELLAVRAERLQRISHEDAIAEGCVGTNWVASSPYISGPHTDDGELPQEEFEKLWRRINGKRPGCAWEDDPWCWVLSFKTFEVNGRAVA